MRPSSFVLFLLLPILPTACAQSASAQKLLSPSITIISPSPSANCPVGLSARRQSASEIIQISPHTHPHAGQGVHLSVNHTPAAIASAEVAVHAASNKPRVLPLDASPDAPDLSRNFHLAGPADPAGLRASDLWLDGAGSILSVDLLSLTFADGTTWTHSPNSVCRAVPSGFLLVSTP